MKISINFKYAENYLPTKRHRKEEKRAINATYQAEIREPKDFPVAIRVTDYGITPQKEGEYKAGTIELRYFEGRCWKEWRAPSGNGTNELIPVDNIASHIEYLQRNSIWESKDKPYVEGVSVVTGDNKDAYMKSIEDEAKGFIIYDNKVWVPSGLPYYKVMTFGLGHNHGGTAIVIDWTDHKTIDLYSFTADQKEKAFEDAIKTAENRGDTNDVPRIKANERDIEVLIPEAYTLKRDLASIDLPDYIWDDERGVFVKDYGKPETPHYDTWLVRFKYKYENYLAKFYTRWKFVHTSQENIRFIVGQLLIDLEDLPASAIEEIYNVDQNTYYRPDGSTI